MATGEVTRRVHLPTRSVPCGADLDRRRGARTSRCSRQPDAAARRQAGRDVAPGADRADHARRSGRRHGNWPSCSRRVVSRRPCWRPATTSNRGRASTTSCWTSARSIRSTPSSLRRRALLGVSASEAREILCASPPVLIGNVSHATVDALRLRFAAAGAEIGVSRRSDSRFDLVVALHATRPVPSPRHDGSGRIRGDRSRRCAVGGVGPRPGDRRVGHGRTVESVIRCQGHRPCLRTIRRAPRCVPEHAGGRGGTDRAHGNATRGGDANRRQHTHRAVGGGGPSDDGGCAPPACDGRRYRRGRTHDLGPLGSPDRHVR